MHSLKECPIKKALNGFKLGNKWTLEIIRDLFYGKRFFSEFLDSNLNLSRKVLSEKLKELTESDLVTKKIVNDSPIKTEYYLTEKGQNLNRVLSELASFGLKYQNQSDSVVAQEALRDLSAILRIE